MLEADAAKLSVGGAAGPAHRLNLPHASDDVALSQAAALPASSIQLPASTVQPATPPGAESGLLSGRVRDYRPGLKMTSSIEPPASSFQLLASGLLLGLIAITKTTVYFALALILGVLVWRWWRERARPGRILRELGLVALPAALLALPWYIRDLDVYGWPDFLGLRQHDLIVTGQMRLGEFLAQHGLQEYLRQLVVVTFQSFWAVFGWMGVFLDVRLYEALAVLCVVVAGGLILHERQARRPEALAPGQRYALRLLAVTALLSLLTYAWYNLQFVQFQGRYLFSGLIPIAVAFGLGWDGVLRPARNSRLLAALLVLLGVVLAVWGVALTHTLPKWPLALCLAAAALLAVRPWLPRRLDGLLFALPYGALPILALYCLYGGVVPQLAR